MIQWFPGHMAAARKKAAEALARIDAVIEVLDARLPAASANPMIESMRRHRQRPALKILNKADLADPKITQEWLAFFAAQPQTKAIAISTKNPGDIKKILPAARALAPHRNDLTKPLRLMAMGVPNVGKSTILNALLQKRAAAVGDEPAVTKALQTYILSTDVTLTDTPGLMWPKIEDPADGLMLAASHAIGVNAMNEEEAALFLGERLLARYPALLAARYRLDAATPDAQALLEIIAQKRACRQKGGGWDLEKAALLFLEDYRSGRLGRISLQRPEDLAERESRLEDSPQME
ncbi:MAG: ribosome biogenesis GTPase YlqF [Zoogloeaceae bacterium]|jgi:ribosome biogenesis GTPase A|nr:ribosome biogenesis GTPase YlqF [Zoogloeaceae bacterium]